MYKVYIYMYKVYIYLFIYLFIGGALGELELIQPSCLQRLTGIHLMFTTGTIGVSTRPPLSILTLLRAKGYPFMLSPSC